MSDKRWNEGVSEQGRGAKIQRKNETICEASFEWMDNF